MKKGFTLVELVVVIAFIAILAVTLAPRLREKVAKARDSKAIALLGAMRSSSEVYFVSNGVATSGIVPSGENNFNTIQEDDKTGMDILMEGLNEESKKLFDSSDYTVGIGGKRESENGSVSFGGKIGYTFHAPVGNTADGISLWFTRYTISPDGMEYDTKGNKWIEY